MSTKLSVIIPIYNSRRFIKESIYSVLNQDFEELEVIVVDDGSDDGSGELIRDIAQQDSRVKLFFQENSGPGVARNLALQYATGEYVLFLDADDMLEKNTLELVWERTLGDKPDLVHFNWKFFWKDDRGEISYEQINHEEILNDHQLSGADCERLLTVENYFSMTNLYRRKFLEEHDIRFGTGRVYEDNVFIVMVATQANSIVMINRSLYLYRKDNHSSASRKKHIDDRHQNYFLQAIKESRERANWRSQQGTYYLMRYFVNKFLVYYKERIPARYRRKFLMKFVDAIAEFGEVAIPKNYSDKFLQTCIARSVFFKKKYALFSLLVHIKLAYTLAKK